MSSLNRSLADDALRFRLEEEVFRIARAKPLERGRSARTLVKDGPLRVTLIALAPGARIAEHHAEGPITIQAVHGTVRVEVAGEPMDLAAGDLLSLGAGVEHAVASAAGGAFLLTLVTPSDC